MKRPSGSCNPESLRRCHPSRTDPEFLVLSRLFNAIQESLSSLCLETCSNSAPLIVDYGCGTRPYDHMLIRSAGRVVGVDLAGNQLADIIFTPGEKLPLPDGDADMVTSIQVLEHVEEPREYLAEAYRLLRPNGKLLISTHGVWPYHPHPNDYHRWTQEGLKIEIENAGFHVEKIVPVLSGFRAVIQLQLSLWRYSRHWHIRIYRWMIKFVAFFCSFLSKTTDDFSSTQDELIASVFLVSAIKPPNETIVAD